MSRDWRKAFIKYDAKELRSLLSLLEGNINAQAARVVERIEAFENTPIDPEADEGWVEHQRGQLDDEFFTIPKHQLWVYGGFMVTVLCWLCDTVMRYMHPRKHAQWPIFMARMGEEVPIEREPYLGSILSEWLVEPSDLVERLKTWIDVRNRFVHSYGFVASAEDRERLARVLGVEFNPDMRMQLTADMCRSLLRDAEVAAINIIGNTRE